MRTQFVAADATNSARRIQRDLKELEENKHQLVGVSAAPLPNNIYEIHGNL
jgi:ubiquitin-protein ligase